MCSAQRSTRHFVQEGCYRHTLQSKMAGRADQLAAAFPDILKFGEPKASRSLKLLNNGGKCHGLIVIHAPAAVFVAI